MLNDEERAALDLRIFGILSQTGIKDTPMSAIASGLRISKRTLYEIYGSKEEMMRLIFRRVILTHRAECERRMREASDAVEALVEFCDIHQEMLERLPMPVFREAETLYPGLLDSVRKESSGFEPIWTEFFSKGIRQGLFRPELDPHTIFRHLSVQAEAIKRMEPVMPDDMSSIKCFEMMMKSLLRGIATVEGLPVIEKILSTKLVNNH